MPPPRSSKATYHALLFFGPLSLPGSGGRAGPLDRPGASPYSDSFLRNAVSGLWGSFRLPSLFDEPSPRLDARGPSATDHLLQKEPNRDQETQFPPLGPAASNVAAPVVRGAPCFGVLAGDRAEVARDVPLGPGKGGGLECLVSEQSEEVAELRVGRRWPREEVQP